MIAAVGGATLCPSCGEKDVATEIADIPSTDTTDHFTIRRCTRCGLLSTAPVPRDLARYYETDLARTMTHAASRVFSALRSLQLVRELARLTAHGDPGTILDVGCGTGDFALVIHRRGLPVIAADTSSERPALLAGRSEIPYVRFDFDTYEFRGLKTGGPYTVVLRHVLEHVREPSAFLARFLTLGARQFYIVVPNAASLERRLLGRHWYLWDPPRHLWHFDSSTLDRVCRRAGLVTVQQGRGTAPTLAPSVYRCLRLRGWPASVYERFAPNRLLSVLSIPLNMLLPGNVLWRVARARS